MLGGRKAQAAGSMKTIATEPRLTKGVTRSGGILPPKWVDRRYYIASPRGTSCALLDSAVTVELRFRNGLSDQFFGKDSGSGLLLIEFSESLRVIFRKGLSYFINFQLSDIFVHWRERDRTGAVNLYIDQVAWLQVGAIKEFRVEHQSM